MYGLKNGQRERQKCNLRFHRNHPRRKLKTSRTRKTPHPIGIFKVPLSKLRNILRHEKKKTFFFPPKVNYCGYGKILEAEKWIGQVETSNNRVSATKETSEFSNDKQKKTLSCFNTLQSFHSFFTQPKTKQSQAERKQKKVFDCFFLLSCRWWWEHVQ